MLTLPLQNRIHFKKPFGIIFSNFSDIIPLLENKTFVTVGDVVTANAFDAGLIPSVCVVDGFTKRTLGVKIPEFKTNIINVENPAGVISSELEDALAEAVENFPTAVVVHGEEDLAVIPMIGLLKDGDVILYGQPGEGVAYCLVDLELRKKCDELLGYFVSV